LKNGGHVEVAQHMAGHSNAKITGLYDRRNDDVNLDESRADRDLMHSSMKWQSYEEIAAYLLNQFADTFGLKTVEGKQTVVGLRSGTNWEIDAKGLFPRRIRFRNCRVPQIHNIKTEPREGWSVSLQNQRHRSKRGHHRESPRASRRS
jgi:hypothetical protein